MQNPEVGVFNGEGPPVPIPNTEVKLTSAEYTCLETDWEDRSMPTQRARIFPSSFHLTIWGYSSAGRAPALQAGGHRFDSDYLHHTVGASNGEGPPVPIPNTEVKLACAEDTRLETDWENRSVPTQI